MLLNVELGKEEEVLNEIKKLKEVKEAYRVYGVYDTILKLEVENADRLKDIVGLRIRKLPNIRSTLTMLAIEL